MPRPPRASSAMPMHTVQQAVERVFASSRAALLATLIRMLGDFDLAEDALQDAFEAALAHWPARRRPDDPRAWLITTARNKAIDRLRRDQNLAGKQADSSGARGRSSDGRRTRSRR